MSLSGLSLPNFSQVLSNSPALQYWTTARASKTLQEEIAGKETPPTITLLTALFNFRPSQSGQGSSFIKEVIRDLVLSDDVSL